MLLIPKALHLNSSLKRQAEWCESRKNVRMAYGETKTTQFQMKKNSDLLKTVALSAENNGCLAGKALNSKEQGRPPTTISLRESKAASQWRKKNTAPAKGEDIVCAGVKASEVCR